MVNLGIKGCQFWITYPMGLPGGDWISSYEADKRHIRSDWSSLGITT